MSKRSSSAAFESDSDVEFIGAVNNASKHRQVVKDSWDSSTEESDVDAPAPLPRSVRACPKSKKPSRKVQAASKTPNADNIAAKSPTKKYRRLLSAAASERYWEKREEEKKKKEALEKKRKARKEKKKAILATRNPFIEYEAEVDPTDNWIVGENPNIEWYEPPTTRAERRFVNDDESDDDNYGDHLCLYGPYRA